MVDLTPSPLASSFLSTTPPSAAGSSSNTRSSNMSQDAGTTASFKETLAGLQLSDPALLVRSDLVCSDPAALLLSGVAAEKSPGISIANSLAASQSDLAPVSQESVQSEGTVQRDRLSSTSALSRESAPSGDSLGLIALSDPTALSATVSISRLSQMGAATQQIADQTTGPATSAETPDSAGEANAFAVEGTNAPSPAGADLLSVTTAALESTSAGTDLSSLVPATSNVHAAREQMAGAQARDGESSRAPGENALAGQESVGSRAARAGLIADAASESGAQMLKRKKKADDLASPALRSNATIGAGSAESQSFSTLTVANGSTSGLSDQTAATFGSNSQILPAVPGDLASEIGLKNNGRTASNTPGSDFAFAVRFRSDAAAQSGSGIESGGLGEAGASGGPNANEKTLQSQTANGSFSELKVASPGGSNVTGSNMTGSNLAGASLAGPNALGIGVPSSRHVAGQLASNSAGDSSAVANSSAADESKLVSESTRPALRSVQVQITGQDNQRVDVKLIERPGALSMSVRAADGVLTRSLQEHLPELTTKLAEQQMPAEWWVPKTSSMGPAGEAGASGDATKQGDSRSQGQTGSSGQDSGKQQGGRQHDQPNWVDELAAMNNSKTSRKEYVWHQ